jgi:hypothetical protein
MESEHLRALYRHALAISNDPDTAARLVERRLRLGRREDADAREDYFALDELLWEQLASEAVAELGPEASQDEYLGWIRARLASALLD